MGIIQIYKKCAEKVLEGARKYQDNPYLQLPQSRESVLLKTGAKLVNEDGNYFISYYAMDGSDCRELFK